MRHLSSVVMVAGLLAVSACAKNDTSDQRSLFPTVADAIHEVVNEGLMIEAIPITEGVDRPTLGGKIEESWGTVTFRYALDEIPEDIFAKESVSVTIDTEAEALIQARKGSERSFLLPREKVIEHFSSEGYASMVDNEFLRVRATLRIDDYVGTGQVNVRIYPGEGYVPVTHTTANTCDDPSSPFTGCHAGTGVSCPALCESQGVETGDDACRMDCMWTTQGGLATRKTCTAAGGRCGPVMGGVVHWATNYSGTIYRDWGGQCNDSWGFWDGCECDDTAGLGGAFLCQERGVGCSNVTSEGCESSCTGKTCGP